MGSSVAAGAGMPSAGTPFSYENLFLIAKTGSGHASGKFRKRRFRRRCNANAMEELDIMEEMDEMRCTDAQCGGFVALEAETQEFRCLRCSCRE
jgi:hypothetical protein